MRTVTLPIEIPKAEWLSANHRPHPMVRARKTRAIRDRVTAHLLAGRIPPLTGPVNVTATISYPTARKADPANAYPTVKAAIDACVTSGLLADDDSEHLPSLTFRRGPKTGRTDWYLVTLALTEVAP